MHHIAARASAVALLITAGCVGHRSHAPVRQYASAGGATPARAGIAIVGRGGVTGWERITVLDSATARYMTVTRAPCGATCAPLDSASGILARGDVAHIYDVVRSEHVFALRDDYGACTTCAGRATITTAVFANRRRKIITSNGEATPEILGRIHVAVAEAIRAARADR